jgi:HSP20 family molecular chaperone IbpA
VFVNGILTITLAKRAEFKPRQITINVTKPPLGVKAKEKAA